MSSKAQPACCEYMLCSFTSDATPAWAGEHDVGGGKHYGVGIAGRVEPTHDTRKRQVDDVVADVRDLCVGDPLLLRDGRERLGLAQRTGHRDIEAELLDPCVKRRARLP